MTRTCQVDKEIYKAPSSLEERSILRRPPTRRTFLKRLGLTTAGLTCADFLSHFVRYGAPFDRRAEALAAGASHAGENAKFLVYWFIEGGWAGYDMFNPVITENHVVKRLENPSDEFYRVLQWGGPGYGVEKHGNIRHGFLASDGRDLFDDMAVLSSMHTGQGHSRDRLKAHMGSYKLNQRDDRQPDERSVVQAFAEVVGQPYALPNLSWHWWLSDGELNEVQYTGRKGYYHALGPSHAHTIYPGPPARLRRFLHRRVDTSTDSVHREVQNFLDDSHGRILKDENIEAVKSYHSALEIYRQMSARGGRVDKTLVDGLFENPALREEFGVTRDDELLTYRSVNGNKARSKFSPNTNVQAMMTYELMRAGLSCAFWIESRDVRRFDSHMSRSRLWGKGGKPIGQKDQTAMMREDLWSPLKAFVRRLKSTPFGQRGESLYDRTTIVLTSEFGRSIHGNVDKILRSKASDADKKKQIGGQDICAHWKVTSCAFLGGNVQGNSQFGRIGEKTLMAIPILPDGSLDPAYDPVTGELRKGAKKNPKSSIPNHGDVYATALDLADINPRGRGRNERGPMKFIKRARTF